MKPKTLKATLTAWTEREREICAAIPFLGFLLPSFPSLFLPSCLQSGQISLALIRSEHWACCWCAVHTPHRGRQIISQPLWAARQKTEQSYWKSTSAPWSLVLGETPEWCGSVTGWFEEFECRDGLKSLNVQSRPEHMYFGDNFQPHLEGLNMAFVLPLLAVKLVLLCVISLPLFLSLQLISMLQLVLLLACASMYKQYGIHLNDLTLCWMLYCRENNYKTNSTSSVLRNKFPFFGDWNNDVYTAAWRKEEVVLGVWGVGVLGVDHMWFKSGTRASSVPGCSAAYTTVSVSVTCWGRQTNAEILWDPSSSSEGSEECYETQWKAVGFHIKKR